MKTIAVLFALLSVALLCAAQTPRVIETIGVPIRNQDAGKDQPIIFELNSQNPTLLQMSNSDVLTFMVTPYSGDVDLFVSTGATPVPPCDTCWKSVSPHGDIINIPRSDSRWPIGTGAKFYVGVIPRTVAKFSLNTIVSNSRITVYDGEPQTANVLRGKYTYFTYNLDTADNFTVAVTPVNGDPDIYVSTEYDYPNSVNKTWSASNWGLDVLNIRSNDPNYKTPGTYNVGVYAFSDTFFSLAITKVVSYTLLIEGVPLANDVMRLDYTYFKFYLAESNTNLYININPITARGDPDLYVIYNDETRGKPSRSNYQYKAEFGGADTLTIPTAAPGWYYIAVYGYSRCVFQITASTEYKNVLLNDGVSVRGGVTQGAYTYYKYYYGDVESGLTISLDMHGTGQAQVYMSKTTSHPTSAEGKHDYVARGSGSNVFYYFPPGTSVGNIYIGVYGVTACNFTLIAATNQSYSLLRDGEVSIFNRVPEGYYRYYIFSISDTSQDVTITVNPWRGEVDLFASAIIPYPRRENSTWRSESWRQDTIVINSDDPLRQNHRRLYIGVYGRTEGYYSLTAYLSNTTLKLDDGVSATGAVSAGKFRYYKFYVTNPGSVTINMELTQPASSEADIYASTSNTHPNPYDYTWKSTKFGNDFIQIEYVGAGWLYIAVAGVVGSRITYSISANVAHTFLTANRASMIAFTKAGKATTFRSFIWGGCSHTVVAATLISGRTQLYISNNATVPASQTNHQWSSRTWPGNVVLISSTDPNYKFGPLAVTVTADVDSEYFISMVCAGSSYSLWYNSAWINEGTPRLGIAPINDSLVYMFRAGDDTGNVTDNYVINIRVMSGSLDVFVSQNWRVHPVQNATWVSRGQNDRILILPRSQLRFGYVFIATYGSSVDRPTRFEITVAKESAPRYLAQDQPQTQLVAGNRFTYYRVLNTKLNPKELNVYVDSCSINPPPTVYASSTNQYPSPSSFQAQSKPVDNSKYSNFLTYKSTESEMYYIGVSGATTGTYYSIFATTSTNSKPVIDMSNRRFLALGRSNGQMALRITKAKNPPGFSSRAFVYVVYKREVEFDDQMNPKPVNMETVCGIQGSAQVDGEFRHHWDNTTDIVEYLVDIDPTKVYQVNVIVHDGLGLANAYEGGWIVFGQFYTTFPGITLFNVSVGFILMLSVFGLFVLYLAVGSIINLIRGKRGVEIIPNVEFWKDLPFLIFDGMKLLVFWKKTDSYSQFNEEPSTSHTVNTSDFNAVNPSTTQPQESTKTDNQPSQSGYGSI